MTDPPLTLDEAKRIMEMASAHGVVEMSFRGLTIRRIPDSTPARTEARTSELERLEKLPPDDVDARLMLKRTKGGV